MNAEGIPGPDGKLWNNTTLRGHAKRGTGIINNELYIGRLVWSRQRYLKDPSTGKRVSRLNPESEWIVTEVPELRIVSDELWQAAKTKQAELADNYANVISAVREHHRTNRLNGTHRPKSLLSGLVRCGASAAAPTRCVVRRALPVPRMSTTAPAQTAAPFTARNWKRVLAGLKDRLMAPEAAPRPPCAPLRRKPTGSTASAAAPAAKPHRTGKGRKGAQGDKIVQAIEDGGYSRMLMDRLRELESRQEALQERLATTPEPLPDIHPNVAHIYWRKVERLSTIPRIAGKRRRRCAD